MPRNSQNVLRAVVIGVLFVFVLGIGALAVWAGPRVWQTMQRMAQLPCIHGMEHANAYAFSLKGGRIVLLGSEFGGEKNIAEIYDPVTNAFSPAPAPAHNRRFGPVGFTLSDGTIVIAGGPPSSGSNGILEGMAPSSKEWRDLFHLPKDVRLSDAVVLPDGRVLFVTEDGESESLLVLDLSTKQLLEVGHPSMVVNGTPLGTLLKDGRVLITHLEYGGTNEERQNTFLFDPKTNKTTPGPQMATDRSQHQATLLLDGRVLVTGGSGRGVSAEIFDPIEDRFSPAGPMVAPRALHQSILLADGRVLILGGVAVSSEDLKMPWTPEELSKMSPDEIVQKTKEQYEKHPPKSEPLAAEVEIFDPRTNRFTAAPAPPVGLLHGDGPRGGLHERLPGGDLLFMSYSGPVRFHPADLTWHFPEGPKGNSSQPGS